MISDEELAYRMEQIIYEQKVKNNELKDNNLNLNWGDAPVWAEWRAVNPNGQSIWFENEPVCSYMRISAWVVENGRIETGTKIDLPLGIDWRTTKQQRPNHSSSLKKCPFCGNEVKLKKSDIYYWVECDGENCPIGMSVSYKSRDVAIQYWNQRLEKDEVKKDAVKRVF